MLDNAQKTPLGRGLNRFAEKKVVEAIQLLGKALPASVMAVSGSIVAVKFEVQTSLTLPTVTIPIAGPEWIRYPTQVGDKGAVFPADVYLGGMSGLGGGIADFSLQANLSALVFFPIGNKNWSATDNPNAVVIYGPDGVVLRTVDKLCTLTLTATGIKIKGNVEIDGNLALSGLITAPPGSVYTGDIKTSGNVIAGFGTGTQVGLETHQHTQAADSHGDAEQPTNAPTPGT